MSNPKRKSREKGNLEAKLGEALTAAKEAAAELKVLGAREDAGGN
jgi:hypothetical protein